MNNDNVNLIFKIDGSFKGTIVFGLLFFGGGLILSLILPFYVPNFSRIWWIWIPIIIGYFILTKISIDAWMHRNDFVELDDRSISINSKKNRIVVLKWNEITEVEEHNILGRFTVTDRNHNTIRLEYQLEKISELLRKIYENIPNLKARFSKLRNFHRTKHHHLFFSILLLFFLSMLFLVLNERHALGAIVFSVLAVLIIYLLLIEFVGLKLLENGIIIRYPIWKRKITFNEIKNISLEMSNEGKGKTSPCVFLLLKNNKKIGLNAVREGAIALYTAMNSCISSMAG